MKLLLINSNNENPFAALHDESGLIISRTSDYIKSSDVHDAGHSLKPPDKLIQCLAEVSRRLEEKDSSLEDIDAISVIIGPGSFTGIRVGLAIAKGTADALDKKIIPIDNFELALNRLESMDDKKYCVLIPAKLPEYYFSIRKNGSEISSGFGEIGLIRTIIDKETAIVGDFADEYEKFLDYFEVLNIKNKKSELDSMLELSIKHYEAGKLYPSEKTEPLYLKDFIAKRKN